MTSKGWLRKRYWENLESRFERSSKKVWSNFHIRPSVWSKDPSKVGLTVDFSKGGEAFLSLFLLRKSQLILDFSAFVYGSIWKNKPIIEIQVPQSSLKRSKTQDTSTKVHTKYYHLFRQTENIVWAVDGNLNGCLIWWLFILWRASIVKYLGIIIVGTEAGILWTAMVNAGLAISVEVCAERWYAMYGL